MGCTDYYLQVKFTSFRKIYSLSQAIHRYNNDRENINDLTFVETIGRATFILCCYDGIYYNNDNDVPNLIGQPEDFGYPAAGRDLQSVQTHAGVGVPHVNTAVHGAGDEQAAGRVEVGGGDLDGQDLAVHLLGVRHGPFDDHSAGAQVPHGYGRVSGGRGYQNPVQRVVQRLDDGRLVRLVVVQPGHVLVGDRRFGALDRHERPVIVGHAHDGLLGPVEVHDGERPQLAVVGFRGHREPVERQQARGPAQVPHLDHGVRGHGVQVPVDRVVGHALHAPAVAQQRGAVDRARRPVDRHVPQPHGPVRAAGGQLGVADGAHAREPRQVGRVPDGRDAGGRSGRRAAELAAVGLVEHVTLGHGHVVGQRHGRERPAGVEEHDLLDRPVVVQLVVRVSADRRRPLGRRRLGGGRHARRLVGQPLEVVLGRLVRVARLVLERVPFVGRYELEHAHGAVLVADRDLRRPDLLPFAERVHVRQISGDRAPPQVDDQAQLELAGRHVVEQQLAAQHRQADDAELGHRHQTVDVGRHYGLCDTDN